MLTSLPGIGGIMMQSQRNFQSSEVYALLVLIGLFRLLVNDASSWWRHNSAALVSANNRR
jgi:ABC-type nitrate/sulfonate/bicarbonate transport system permease component